MTTKTESMYKYLKIGSHLGKKFVNPDMENYHMGVRNNIAIVDVKATLLSFYRSLYVIKKVIDSKGNILFLNTSSELSSLVKKVANKIQSNFSIQVVRPVPDDGPAFLSSLLARQSSTLRLRHHRRGASYCGAAHFAVPATRLINVLDSLRKNSKKYKSCVINCQQYSGTYNATILPLPKSARPRYGVQQRGDKYQAIVPRYTQIPTVVRRLGPSYWHTRVPTPSFIAPSKGRPTMMRSSNRERSELDLDPKAYGVSTDCTKNVLRRIEKGWSPCAARKRRPRFAVEARHRKHRVCWVYDPPTVDRRPFNLKMAQVDRFPQPAYRLPRSFEGRSGAAATALSRVACGRLSLSRVWCGVTTVGSKVGRRLGMVRASLRPTGTLVLASSRAWQPQVARHCEATRVTSNLNCASHFATPTSGQVLALHTYAQPFKKPFSVPQATPPLRCALACSIFRDSYQHSMRVCRVDAAALRERGARFDQPSKTKVDNAQAACLTSESNLPINIGYCNDKWSGGTLTNWKQISQSVAIFAKFYKYTSQFNSTSRYRRVYYADLFSSASTCAAISLRHYIFKVVQTTKNGCDPRLLGHRVLTPPRTTFGTEPRRGSMVEPPSGRVLTTSKLQQKHIIPAADTGHHQNSRYLKMTKCFRGLIILNKRIKQTPFYRIQAILNNYPCASRKLCLHTSVQVPDRLLTLCRPTADQGPPSRGGPTVWGCERVYERATCFAAPRPSLRTPSASRLRGGPTVWCGYTMGCSRVIEAGERATCGLQVALCATPITSVAHKCAAHSNIGACIHHEPEPNHIGLRPTAKSSHSSGRIVLAHWEPPRWWFPSTRGRHDLHTCSQSNSRPTPHLFKRLTTLARSANAGEARRRQAMVFRTTTRLNGKANVLILKWRLLGRKIVEISSKFYQYIPMHRQSSVGRALFCKAFGVSTSRTHHRFLSDVNICRPSLRRPSDHPVNLEVQLCFNSIGDLCHHTEQSPPLGDLRIAQVTLNPQSRDRPLGNRNLPGGNTLTFGQVYPCNLLIVFNPNDNKVAIREARSLGLPVLSFVDSNTKLMGITYPVIGNVGSLRFIHLYMSWIIKLIRNRMRRIPRRSRPD